MRRLPLAALVGLAVLTGCASTSAGISPTSAPPTTAATTTTAAATTSTSEPETTTTTTTVAPAPAPDTRATLAPLMIDDRPPPAGYRRDEWPHWLDLDGDGCDAREQVLRATSEIPVPPAAGCKVTTGRWTSAYDGQVITEGPKVDMDHVVPLAEAFRSGGDRWSTDQRARFANDPAELWPVSAASNRSKGDDPPDQWRPPDRASWCTYARRWVAVKVAYKLTATTAERDALGQMLDTCPAAP
jgi:hypothetical protein